MNIDLNRIKVTSWERGPAKNFDGNTAAITLTYRGQSELPTLTATFEAPPCCSDADALKLAHHWFHTLCTNLGKSTSAWVLAEGQVEALWKKQ